MYKSTLLLIAETNLWIGIQKSQCLRVTHIAHAGVDYVEIYLFYQDLCELISKLLLDRLRPNRNSSEVDHPLKTQSNAG